MGELPAPGPVGRPSGLHLAVGGGEAPSAGEGGGPGTLCSSAAPPPPPPNPSFNAEIMTVPKVNKQVTSRSGSCLDRYNKYP